MVAVLAEYFYLWMWLFRLTLLKSFLAGLHLPAARSASYPAASRPGRYVAKMP